MMEPGKPFSITREKHFDHMVKVVPFIVFCYAVQSYVILRVSPTEFSQVSLSILGGFLAFMIAGFIFYDLKHQVTFFEDHLEVKFLTGKKTIRYQEIQGLSVRDPGQTFSNFTLKTSERSHTFYFIDDADKIKSWLEKKNTLETRAA